jgi:hypothetical protein
MAWDVAPLAFQPLLTDHSHCVALGRLFSFLICKVVGAGQVRANCC